MALRLKGEWWYTYFRDERGRVNSRSLRTKDRKQAEVLQDEFMELVRSKRRAAAYLRDFPGIYQAPSSPEASGAPAAPPVHQRGGIKISDMWQCAMTKRKLSITHKRVWDRFVQRIGVRYADLVTPKIALDYLSAYYSKGNGKTYNNVKTILNTVFRCCLVEANLSASPFASIINKRIDVVDKHRNLTEDEFNRLFQAAPLHLQIMMMLSRWTCQRLETCARMTPEMFDFNRLVFMIDPGKTKRFGKWVCVPIMPELEEYLRPILSHCKPGIPIVRNISSCVNARYTKTFRKLMTSLGICDTSAGKASFHSIRGTAITWFKEHGVKGEELRSITGHTSDKMEDIYARDIASLERIAKAARLKE